MNIISSASDRNANQTRIKWDMLHYIFLKCWKSLALGMAESRHLNNIRNPFHSSPLAFFIVAIFIGLPSSGK